MVVSVQRIKQFFCSPWGIVILALSARLIYSFVILPCFFGGRDLETYGGYDQLAERLVHGYGFTYPDGTVNLQRVPLYILFLGVHYAIFGVSRAPVLFSQAVLGALSVYLIWYSGRKMLTDNNARIAAVIYAFYPFAIWRNANMLADVLMVPLLLVVVILSLRLFQQSGPLNQKHFLGVGFACSMLTYTKPIAALLPLVIVFFLLLSSNEIMWRKLKLSALLLAVYALLLTPWMIRNAMITGIFPLFSDGSGFVRHSGVVYADNFDWHNMSSKALDYLSYTRLDILGHRYGWRLIANPEMYSYDDDKQISHYITHNHILMEPLKAVKRYLQNICFFWFLANDHWKSCAYLLIQIPLVVVAFLRFIMSFREKNIVILFMGVVVVYFCGVNSIIIGQVRYSDPVMPLIILLAVSLLQSCQNYKSR